MPTDDYADLEELASLRLARALDENARARMDAFREIRSSAAARGIDLSSGVVWGQRLGVLRKSASDRMLAVARIWHQLIKENRGGFSDDALAFVLAKVEPREDALRTPIEVDGFAAPPAFAQQVIAAIRDSGNAAKAWLAERRAEARLQKQAAASADIDEARSRRDPVTGLSDRGAFETAFGESVNATTKTGEPLSAVMIDLDFFKKVNDTHGHAAGDAVLRGVAQRIEQASRGKGRAYRVGGEEMLVLLPNHSPAEALAVAERLRLAIASAPVGELPVTASVGVATIPDHASNGKTLYEAADRAMYDAKKLGRNLVRLFGEPPPTSTEPRTVERLQPQAGWLAEEQRLEMRRNILRQIVVKCPIDGAHLTVHDATHMGSRGKEFVIHCPDCGRSERLLSPHQ